MRWCVNGHDILRRMDKHKILAAAKAEIQRHTWGTFADGNGISIAQGGKGVVVSGCQACRKRLQSNAQYPRHLSDDVMPVTNGFRDYGGDVAKIEDTSK
jgi:hypothetical protein